MRLSIYTCVLAVVNGKGYFLLVAKSNLQNVV